MNACDPARRILIEVGHSSNAVSHYFTVKEQTPGQPERYLGHDTRPSEDEAWEAATVLARRATRS